MPEHPPSHASCCRIESMTCPCPVCGNAGRKVTALTLDPHVPGHLRASLGGNAAFCLNSACEVVYCNPKGFVVKRGDTIESVTIKDSGDDVRVCYCFDIRRGDIRAALAQREETGIPERIKAGIAEGRCDCERKNPQGACCLGNVTTEIKKIRKGVQDHT